MDPRVLTARVDRAQGPDMRAFDAKAAGVRIVRSPSGEHVLIERGGHCIRIDVYEGSVVAAPVRLRFDIVDDDRLAAQIAAIGAFGDLSPGGRKDKDPVRQLLALAAFDARRAGASLRETADLVMGPAYWPGDGEHRKSQVRRLIAAGDRMVAAGPGPILANFMQQGQQVVR